MKKKILLLLLLSCCFCSKVYAGDLVIQAKYDIPINATCYAPAYSLKPYTADKLIVYGGSNCDSMVMDKQGNFLKNDLGTGVEVITYSNGNYLILKKTNSKITLNLFNEKHDSIGTAVLSENIRNINAVRYALDDKDNFYMYVHFTNSDRLYKYNLYVFNNKLENLKIFEVTKQPSTVVFISVIDDVIYLGGEAYDSEYTKKSPVIFGYDLSFKNVLEMYDENENVKNTQIVGLIEGKDDSFIVTYGHNTGYEDTIIKKFDKNFKIIWTMVAPNEKPYGYWYADDLHNIHLKKGLNGTYFYYGTNLIEFDEDGKILNEYLDVSMGKDFYPYKNGVIYSYFDGDENLKVNYISKKSTIKLNETNVGGYRVNRKTPRYGEKVDITLRIPKKYELDKLEVKGKENIDLVKESDKVYSFVMPDEDVEINVSYKKITK